MNSTDTTQLLAGKVAVVTGAGAGVGKGIAEAYAQHGGAVVIAARRAENGEPTAEAIRNAGGQAQFYKCDVVSRDDIDSAVSFAVETYGRLDCMVHNALSSVGDACTVQDSPPGIWEDMRTTAVRASFDSAQAAYPELKKTQGNLVLVTSTVGVEGSAHLPIYAIVKAAQRGLTKSLAKEWGADNIRVNAISPVAYTPAMERAYEVIPILEQALAEATPLGRVGDPTSDIGPTVVFLASDLARYVTGQTITVDGGTFTGL